MITAIEDNAGGLWVMDEVNAVQVVGDPGALVDDVLGFRGWVEETPDDDICDAMDVEGQEIATWDGENLQVFTRLMGTAGRQWLVGTKWIRAEVW